MTSLCNLLCCCRPHKEAHRSPLLGTTSNINTHKSPPPILATEAETPDSAFKNRGSPVGHEEKASPLNKV